MKVVLFCGGLGIRVRAYSENIHKPMVPEAARNGDELVLEPFNRLIKTRELVAYKHEYAVSAPGRTSVCSEGRRRREREAYLAQAANAKIEVKAFRERVLPRAGRGHQTVVRETKGPSKSRS